MFLFQFVGFVQVKNLKQTLNRLIFTVNVVPRSTVNTNGGTDT